MFYQKNLPLWERIVRVCIGLVIIGITLHISLEGWMQWLIIGSAALFVFFGFIGFCPMCAMVGRKLDTKK